VNPLSPSLWSLALAFALLSLVAEPALSAPPGAADGGRLPQPGGILAPGVGWRDRLAAGHEAGSAITQSAPDDTLEFAPPPPDDEEMAADEDRSPEDWLRAPIRDDLLTDVDVWRAIEGDNDRTDLLFDYNRVDRLRLGVGYQIQSPETMTPRLAGRVEYAFGRERTLYGAQIEQPLMPSGRLAAGASMVRRTDHGDLQQVEDVENSLALLFARQDYRDYFEREGFGAYLRVRVPGFSNVSLHFRNDEYRSLALHPGTRSWFARDRSLRVNPPIAEGEAHSLVVRLDRLARRTHRTRAGFYHAVDVERAGYGLGGSFQYTRALADVRSVLRVSPATTLAVRAVAGHTASGALPFQKEFTAGGVDGLRAHRFSQYRGDEMLLAQAEYSVGLWRVRSGLFEGGLHAIAFLDLGKAWSSPGRGWDLDRQRFQADGGLGLGTSEDNLRIYFAKNLHEPDSDLVVSLRLQRPF